MPKLIAIRAATCAQKGGHRRHIMSSFYVFCGVNAYNLTVTGRQGI